MGTLSSGAGTDRPPPPFSGSWEFYLVSPASPFLRREIELRGRPNPNVSCRQQKQFRGSVTATLKPGNGTKARYVRGALARSTLSQDRRSHACPARCSPTDDHERSTAVCGVVATQVPVVRTTFIYHKRSDVEGPADNCREFVLDIRLSKAVVCVHWRVGDAPKGTGKGWGFLSAVPREGCGPDLFSAFSLIVFGLFLRWPHQRPAG